MIAENKLKAFQELISALTREELIWLNGYLSALLEKPMESIKNEGNSLPHKITIAYATETGNSKKLASELAIRAKQKGVHARVQSLDQYRPSDLVKEEFFFAIVSTHGDGEPPAAGRKFFQHIHHNGFRLDKMKYSILALGDSAYPMFCKAGEDMDRQLENLGAERITEIQRCDVDFQSNAEQWFAEVLGRMENASRPEVKLKPGSRRTGGKKFLKGTIIANINLNDRGSAKQTHHIEIGIERVDYEPGDSIGVVPVNSDKTVLEILDRVGADAEEQIEHRFGRMSMFDLLKTKLNITCLPERVVGRYAGITGNEISGERWHLSDLVKAYPVKNSEIWKEIFQSLEPIAPRLYSISSSPKAHPDEIHLTVSKSNYEAYGETRYGLCSDILTGLQVQDMQEFYIHKNHQFRLPDSEKPIVMIGPGTGIAPFRSFLSHRDASGATGYNWLFFGEQHFISDFLYQSEIQQWVQTGVLKHVHLAFSRDQADKIYVQHRIREQGREIYNWIEKGAVIYVCGSRNPMSEDVENAFRSIISEHGKRKDGQAEEFLEELKSSGRYLTDVY